MKLVENPDEFEQPPAETNVVRLRMISRMPLSPDQVLKEAIGQLDGVVVLGWLKSDPENRSAGDEYFVSSIADGATVVWLLERAKYKLLAIADEDWQPGDIVEPA